MKQIIEETHFILNQTRWNILECITKGVESASPMAKETGKSVAFIGQQLALLEAHGFIKEQSQKKDKNGVGKPAKKYEIAKEISIIISIKNDELGAQTIGKNSTRKFQLSSLLASKDEDLYFVQKLYYTHDNLFNIIHSVSIVEVTANEIHLFVISSDVETLRKEKSAITMTSPEGVTKTFILWAHTLEEVQEGLKRKEPYFIDKLLKSEQIWEDETTSINDLKKEWEGIQGKA